MCRIFGYFGENKISEQTIRAVSEKLYHGGPDSQNFIKKNLWSLGANRLAIQGIEGGDQPYIFCDKIYAIFNGEIYNHNQLRKTLKNMGYSFQDNCDGSIIPTMRHGEHEVRSKSPR